MNEFITENRAQRGWLAWRAAFDVSERLSRAACMRVVDPCCYLSWRSVDVGRYIHH